MAYLALLEDVHAAAAAEMEDEDAGGEAEEPRERLRAEREFNDRTDLLAKSDSWLISRFRLPRHVLIWLCNRLDPLLRRPTRRSHAIPVHAQVLTTLGCLATGSFQRDNADRSGITQPSQSRCMPSVLEAIKSLTQEYIRFPFEDDQQTVIKREFYEIARFPNVVGLIDCTHVRIRPPSVNDYAYINRKNYHSINVQVICDANLSLLNVVARWPGGSHDSFIFSNSHVGTQLEAGALRGRSHLLGEYTGRSL